ncbi:penicillin-binding protein-related factor A (putative recombinase) [Thermodesulfitimonas autotrophica]|uniref:Holliday junction resolvase RecU n=1 Tax=Thermodesulfitimonas autotrophica TaxID=1894989 RepID=A0A3N5AWI6_9THEO|nr:Holliday junction resolvase RecU [Thermodesulfitimonas autotrophica]RPF49596.1 penicillin-binding protein-related factor A (putative recombinase) [Thermodesulfitimonas autotrophica]
MLSVYANRGCALEDLVEAVFEANPNSKVFRQNNRWVPLRSGKGGAFPSRGAPVDFVGCIEGVPVAIECKETSSPRLPLTESRFPEKEKVALVEFERAGGRSFIVAAFWRENALAVFKLETFLRALEHKKSVKYDDADAVISLDFALELPVRIAALTRKRRGRREKTKKRC